MKDEDFADEELTPAQADPYLCEADLEVEGNEEASIRLKKKTDVCRSLARPGRSGLSRGG